MAESDTAKVIRKVRQKLEVSQEGLSRLLNATKGAILHWERGRNNPDLARLLALRQLCPPGQERKELETLIRNVQAQVAPITMGPPGAMKTDVSGGRGGSLPPVRPSENLLLLRREVGKLRRQVEKLEATIERKNERLKVLGELAAEQERDIAQLRGGAGTKAPATPSTGAGEAQ